MKRRLEKTIEDNLRKSSLWLNKIERDCKKQDVFLTIRDNRIDFYHKGGRLFCFDNTGFKTHLKYASVITANGKDYLTESELSGYRLASNFEINYPRIKENCSKYSRTETLGVSNLYHKHSYLSDRNVVVLDIEVSFESLNEKNKQDRIDILLYKKDSKTLQFVEAKHYSNPAIWSKTIPEVINQINRYESQIRQRKSEILSEYVDYVQAINNIFSASLLGVLRGMIKGNPVQAINNIFSASLPKPTDIDEKVTLLIFGFDNDQKSGRLKKITENVVYSGIKNYSIGNIKQVAMETLWNAKVL